MLAAVLKFDMTGRGQRNRALGSAGERGCLLVICAAALREPAESFHAQSSARRSSPPPLRGEPLITLGGKLARGPNS